MSKGLTALTEVETAEVSLLRRGANQERVAITKGADDMPEGMEEVLKAILEETEAENEPELVELMKQAGLSEKAMAAAQAAARLLSGFKDEEGMAKVMEAIAGISKQEHEDDDPEKKKKEEEAAAMAKQEDDKKKEEDDSNLPEQFKKADGSLDLSKVPAEMRPVLAELWKSKEAAEAGHAETVKKNAELAETIKKERDDRLTKEFVTKAEVDYHMVPEKNETLGPILKQLDETPIGKAAASLLKTMSDQLAKSALFEASGRAGSGPSGNAHEEIEKKAAELRKADPSITKEAAYVRVAKEHPDLKAGLYSKEGV
jgi:hypothetical protein